MANVRIGYFIGVDGGGSGTRARVLAADGRFVGEGEAGPSGLSQGVAQAWAHVQEAIAAAFGGTPAAAGECALGLGLAGAHDAALRAACATAAPRYGALVVDTDSHAALLGAHGGRPGIVVIAGTGSIGEALYANGRRRVCGGWGFPVGDEGSGAWLGLRAMAVAQRAADGRGSAGPLARAVWQHAGGSDETTLRAWCLGAGQQRYARLAPLVFDHEAADPAAARLIERALDAIAAMACALDATLPVATTGSIGKRLAPRLPRPLSERIVAPAGDALDGALRLARQAAAR